MQQIAYGKEKKKDNTMYFTTYFLSTCPVDGNTVGRTGQHSADVVFSCQKQLPYLPFRHVQR